MLEDRRHWEKHYHGTAEEQAFARKFSYSDRIRYYWPTPSVSAALHRLLSNLKANPLPLNLLSQYLPNQHLAVRENRIANTPEDLIRHKIMEVVEVYASAVGALNLEDSLEI